MITRRTTSPSSPAIPHPSPSSAWVALDADSRNAIPLFDVEAIRRIEAQAQAALPSFTLMSRAGAAAARWLAHHVPAGGLLFLAGPGNNGGDALVAATQLHQAGRIATVWLAADPARLPTDAARAWQEAGRAGVPVRQLPSDFGAAEPVLPEGTTALVDGLLGIGLSRPAQGIIAACIAFLNARHSQGFPVLALDIPSGLSADTGSGAPAVTATRTLTFIAAKPGLLTLDGRDCAGPVDIGPIGLPYPPQAGPVAHANVPAGFIAALPARRHASHKGSFGTLAVVGGGTGMVGAPLLGARAALHIGAGRVHVGFLAPAAPLIDPLHPELMLHAIADVPWRALSALVIGPGLGTGADAATQLARALSVSRAASGGTAMPVVLDADALNLLASTDDVARQWQVPAGIRVLTPHPLEAARLARCTVTEVQQDRIGTARRLAAKWDAVIVLKGSGTVIAERDRKTGTTRVAINPTGNAGLATAGTGDVLAGVIGALLAQGMPAYEAACAAVWIHGRAAEDLVAQGIGPAGLTASELSLPARARLNALMRLAEPDSGIGNDDASGRPTPPVQA